MSRTVRQISRRSGGAQACMLLIATSLWGIQGCGGDAARLTDPAVSQSARSASGNSIVVATVAELVAALSPENAGRRILVRAGTYAIDAPLTVPDGTTLEGEGRMLFDDSGLPTGFEAGTRSTITMTGADPGNVLTLGDGVTIKGLQIVDLAGRAGNVVAIVSREPNDRVSATILESELVNPNPGGVSFDGPTGAALVVTTRNPNMGADPPAHEGSVISARMARSITRSPANGDGVFAFNFAANGKVSVTLDANVIGGDIKANGGVSRPDAVHDSETRLESHRNLYRNDWATPCASPSAGWTLIGGSGSPVPIPLPETARNTLRVQSIDDRIEGFTTGISATGATRFFDSPIAGPSTGNSVELQLVGTSLSTPACDGAPFVADISLIGAFTPFGDLFPGNDNRVRADIRGVTGSGQRFNVFAKAVGASGPLASALAGSGNAVEIVGSPQAFAATNRDIAPAPAPELFTSALH